jgi:hypothetical protein
VVALGLRGGAVGAPHQSRRRASYGVRRHGICGAKQCGGHEESYLGFGGHEEAVPRARGVGAASPVRDVSGGLPRRSPGSQFCFRDSTSRSSSSSYAATVVRSYESRVPEKIMKLGF